MEACVSTHKRTTTSEARAASSVATRRRVRDCHREDDRSGVASVGQSRPRRVRQIVGAVLGGGLLLLGVAELVTRLDEPAPLLFWLPTLWGGGALVLLGVFRVRSSTQRSLVCVILGALLGFLPSAWTVVMPLLSIALIFLTIQQPSVERSSSDASG